jgi:hypothetical protein
MTDPIVWLIAAAAALIALTVAAQAALRGWQGWLDLKRAELDLRRDGATPPTPAARIDLADLKERVRKLEAIAAGVDY